jgi:putative nucleotidyltransferase with HDIG domain
MDSSRVDFSEQETYMENIDEIVARIDSLAPIPPVATQILSLVEDQDACMSEIAELIRHDPSITANVLKICNSAYFGLVQKVESIQDALTLLGLDRVTELVLMNCLSSSLGGIQQGYQLGEGQLWRHAVTSAHVSVLLAERVGGDYNKHLLFTAALLKDIGKLVLSRYVAASFDRINSLVDTSGYSFNESEKKVIGISHEDLGAIVAEKWSFSDRMVRIIRNHHLLQDSESADMETQLVHLSDLMCLMMGVGTGADGLAYRFYSTVLDQVGVTDQIVEDIMLEASSLQKQIDELISLV